MTKLLEWFDFQKYYDEGETQSFSAPSAGSADPQPFGIQSHASQPQSFCQNQSTHHRGQQKNTPTQGSYEQTLRE